MQRMTFVLLLFAGVGASLLVLTWDLRPFPLSADVDDSRYVLSADYIKSSPRRWIRDDGPLQWLGPYDPTTLFKRPGISIVLAALSALHLPFIQTVLLLYLGGVAILVNSLLRLHYPRTVVSALFLVCGLLPTLYDSNAVRVIREIATGGLEMAIFGLCLALFSLESKRSAGLLCSRTFLALLALLGLHWSMREEAVLLLPPVLLLVNGALWLRGGSDLRRRFVLSGIASILLLIPSQLAYLGFAGVNEASYGIRVVNEVSEGHFPRAVSTLKRVDESPCDHRLLTADEVGKVMAVSPSFRVVGETLAIALAHRPDMIYSDAFSVMRVAALRDKDIGASALLTQDLFARITDEVETACRDGRLHCGDRASGSIVPLLCSSQWPIVASHFVWHVGDHIARMRHSGLSPWWSGLSRVGRLHPAQIARFEEITRQKLAGRNAEEVEFSQPAPLELLQRQDRRRHVVASIYMTAMPWLMALGVAGLLLRVPSWRDHSRPWWWIVLLAMAGHFGGRALAFSYLSAVDGYLNNRHISVCYPVAAAFTVLAVAELRYCFFTNAAIRAGVTPRDIAISPAKNQTQKATAAALVVVLGFIYAGVRPGSPVVMKPFGDSRKGTLVSESAREFIELEGRRIEIVAQRQGWLYGEAGWLRGESATFDGWGMDVVENRPAESILLFVNGQLLNSATPTVPIPSLEHGFSAEAHAGFSMTLPRTVVVGNSVRVFALLHGDQAGELHYTPSYPYRH